MEPTLRSPFSTVTFSHYTEEDINSLSVVEVESSNTFQPNGDPSPGGVYDAKFGAQQDNDICPICKQNQWKCPGHFGTIRLCMPVYHPLYLKELIKLVAGICPNCYSLRIAPIILNKFVDALKLLARGHIIDFDVFSDDETDYSEARQRVISALIKSTEPIEPNSYIVNARADLLKEFYTKIAAAKLQCCRCNHTCNKIKYDRFHDYFVREPLDTTKKVTILRVADIKKMAEDFFDKNPATTLSLYNTTDSSFFFISSVVVPPVKFRPIAKMPGRMLSHPSSSYLSDIAKIEHELHKAIDAAAADSENEELAADVQRVHDRLQNSVSSYIDSSLYRGTKKPPNGIRQLLEKKEGLFRKNLMGKRVNFSARSVIAPDPYIATDEIGVPELFAKTLSFPESVNEYNKERLSEYIINGPDKYPGANFFIDSYGVVFRLAKMPEAKRKSLATKLFSAPEGPYPFIVGRHAINGDYTLINRQPTLHRVSILGLKCRILPNQRTLRLHYANCASFNADFDGDEINLHLPQSHNARADVKYLSLANNHYVTPTAGAPIRGLVQDHVDSGVLLTMKNKFFTCGEYQQLVLSALGNEASKHIELVEPAIILPTSLWTGKQVITTVLLNLLEGKPALNMTSRSKFPEALMKLWPGEWEVCFCNGELVHGVLDKAQYGASNYGLVHAVFELYGSDAAGRLLTQFARLFTFYLQEHGFTCGIDDMIITRRAEHHRSHIDEYTIAAARETQKRFFNEFGDPTSPLNEKQQMLRMMLDPSMKERYDRMMKTELNKIATNTIKTIFPTQMRKQFPANQLIMMTQSGAKGSIVNVSQIACLLGQQELEGKRVPLMPSGKALPSFGPMDISPIAGGFIASRFITGLKPQEYYFHCMAGREGLIDTAVKTANTGYLQRCIIKQLEGVRVAYDQTVRNSDNSIVQFLYGEDGIDPLHSKYLHKFDFMTDNYDAYVQKLDPAAVAEQVDTDEADTSALTNNQTLQSKYPPHLHVGSVSENFMEKIAGIEDENTKALAMFNYHKSLIEPGEVVGIIAAQAIGEPATQMTLNTFHLAGYGGTNVTLGIPRLREILMVATDSPATPMMTLPLTTTDEVRAKAIAQQFKQVPLRDIVSSYRVAEDILESPGLSRVREILFELALDSDKVKAIVDSPIELSLVLRSKVRRSLKRKLAAAFRSFGVQIFDREASQKKEANVSSRLEEMGADAEKAKERKTDARSYERDEADDQASEELRDDDDAVDDLVSHESVNYDIEKSTISINFKVANVSVRVLLSSMVEEIMDEIMVKEIPGVTRATVMDPKSDGTQQIAVEGTNFEYVLRLADVAMSSFYSNDINLIFHRYGIEAARTAIIREVSSVFGAYGISVDSRHLQLVSDYVTSSGRWLGMNRYAMKACPSPFQQMSFETTTVFLKQAALNTASDAVCSPSASLAVGNVVNFGSGMCDVVVPVQ